MIKPAFKKGGLVKVRKFPHYKITPMLVERHDPLLPAEANNESDCVELVPGQIGLYVGTVRRLFWQKDIVLIGENVVEINQGLLLAL